MAVTILLLACVLGIVAYRKWALGVAGVLLMGAVIVGSVVTRASVKPLDAIPSLIGTVAGLVVLRLLITRLWRMQEWPDRAADLAAKEPERPGDHPARVLRRRRHHRGRLGHRRHRRAPAQRGPQQRGRGPRIAAAARARQGRRRGPGRCPVQGARRHAVADPEQRLLPDRHGPERAGDQRPGLGTAHPRPRGTGSPAHLPGPARRPAHRIPCLPDLRVQPGRRQPGRQRQMAGHAHPRRPEAGPPQGGRGHGALHLDRRLQRLHAAGGPPGRPRRDAGDRHERRGRCRWNTATRCGWWFPACTASSPPPSGWWTWR